MWRTFVVPVLHKQVGLIRNSSGCYACRCYSVHVTGKDNGDNSLKTSISDQQYAGTTSQNIAKAQSTVIGLLSKLHDSDKLPSKVETSFPLVQTLLDHINGNTSLVKENQIFELTICTPNTRRNGEDSGFGYRRIFMDFEKWCYGVVVVSSLISWHRLLCKDERKKAGNKELNATDFVKLVNEPLRVLPVNGPAKPVDNLDAACSSLENAMTDCTAVAENALAIRFSTLKLHEKALRFFHSASMKGNVAAHFNVGLCYEKGLGTTKNISKAVSSYTVAASYGHLKATFNLAIIFLREKNFLCKESDGLALMEKAAKGGLIEAQRFLGLYYADNSNEHYNINKSAEWLKIASERNDSTAQYHLGICYEKGLGMARNMHKAREMYCRAAENGHASAQYNYGVFHEHGLGGLCVDKHEALRWYSTAVENGNVNAKDNVECLHKELGTSKRIPNLLERLFSDIWIPKQPTVSNMPRCSSTPDRLFLQSDQESSETSHGRSVVTSTATYEDGKCVWVV